MTIRNILLSAILATVSASPSVAGITIGNPITVSQQGLGFGNAPTILAIASTPNEEGSVTWEEVSPGVFEDVVTGDTVNQQTSQTITAAEIAAAGTSNLGVSFNMNESDQELTMEILTVFFYTIAGDGETILNTETAVYNGPTVLQQPGGGQGGDGYFFPLIQMTNELDLFLANPQNRLGLSTMISGSSSNGGVESFRIATAVPEPGAFLFFGLLSAGLVIRRKVAV